MTDGEIMKNIIKKLIVPAIIILAIAAIAPMAMAADAPYTYEAQGTGVVITGCNTSYEGEVKIPSKIDGAAVIAIADYAFDGCEGVTKVVIPNSVKTVGEGAFANCISLKSITIGTGLTKISDGMFEGCASLSNITLPESITAIGEYAFWCCDSLKKINLYPTITEIGSYAFYDCDALEAIALPETVTAINEGLFADCGALASVSLPDSITVIHESAFEACDKIATIYYTGSAAQWSHILIESEGNDDIYNGQFSYRHTHEYTIEVFGEPACVKPGDAIYTCLCSYAYIGQVEPLGHEIVAIKEVKATCTTDGLTAGEKCSRCNEILTPQQVIPASGHLKIVDEAVDPTCTSEGKTSGIHCEYCGEIFEKQETIAKLPHNFETKEIVQATLKKNGHKVIECADCKYVENKVLYNVSDIKLKATSYVYTGKAISPKATVTDSDGNVLVEDTDYTVTYSAGRKAIGKYTAKITLIGDYSGTKTLSFSITADKTAKITRTSTAKGTMKLTWEKVEGASGYYVYIYNKTSDTKNPKRLATVTGTSYTITKDYNGKALVVGKDYKIAVRAFTKLDDGSILYAKAGVAKTFKLYPAKPTITAKSTVKGKVNLSWTNVAGEKGYGVFYSTSKDGKYTRLDTTKTDVVKLTKSLKSGKTYYFKVRSYTVVDGKTVTGAFGNIQSVKIK